MGNKHERGGDSSDSRQVHLTLRRAPLGAVCRVDVSAQDLLTLEPTYCTCLDCLRRIAERFLRQEEKL